VSREPDNLVLELLRNIRADVARVDEKIERVDEKVDRVKSELQSEINSLRADVAADFIAFRKETGEQIAGLRRAVVEYHSAVLGHGVLISDLEGRVRRMEQHLGLPGRS
jgi:predicted GNAT superfamily acetyltransferase